MYVSSSKLGPGQLQHCILPWTEAVNCFREKPVPWDVHCTAVNVTDGSVTLAFIHTLYYALQYIKPGHVCSQGVNLGLEQVRAGGASVSEEPLGSMRRPTAKRLSEAKYCLCVCVFSICGAYLLLLILVCIYVIYISQWYVIHDYVCICILYMYVYIRIQYGM